MIKNGTRPTKPRHLNRDYLKSFHPQIYAGTQAPPVFPAEFLTDDGSWMPNQNADGLPEGCTDYAQSNLAKNLGESVTPQELEAVTHANASGGYSIQMSLDAARKLGWFTYTYQIAATGPLDYFDTFRLAQSSGLPEKRSISWGTPWFSSWEQAAMQGIKIMPMPTPQELAQAQSNPGSLPWHNSMLDGWTQENGVLAYRDKSWQGAPVDYLYFTRDVINTIMTLNGTAAFTATNMVPNSVQTIDLSFIDKWLSYIRTWLGIAY